MCHNFRFWRLLLNLNWNDNFRNDWNDNNSARICLFIKWHNSLPYGESFTKEWFSSEISKHHYEKAKMKTYKNLYKNLLSKDYIKQVMLENLGSKKYADKVRANVDSYVDYIYQSLVNKNYALKPTKTIVIHDRKKDRNITLSPYFPNKIYDYLITSQLKPIIKNSLFYWCIGNVKGKGKDMGVSWVRLLCLSIVCIGR